MCWGMEHFLSGEFKKRTKGVGNDPSPYGGTLSGQLYPYLTAYTYHHGNMTHIESDMSKKLRADNNGENPLYMVETRMLTAMTTVRMLNSRNNLKNNWVKLTDSMGDVLPILEPNHRNTQKIRKIANNNVTFLKYSDINAYGFLSIVQKNNLYCVQSKLPSGKTHDIDCTLSSYDTLDTVGPNSGVLEFVDFTKVNSKVNIGDLSIGSNVIQDSTCGIGKDPYVTDGSDILSKQTEENYLDDPSFGFTVAVPIGNEASYYLSGIGDGNTFFYQVVQFKISSQKTAPTFRDSQNGRTGNGPTVVTPGTQLDFPKRYVGMALYRHFYISTITSIELESSGRVGINALFGAETSGSSDVNYRDPPSEQSDGKVSTTLGGFTAYNPDYKTYRNTLTGGSGTVFYENHQGASAVASFDGQFSEVFFTSTGGFGPLWRFESVWQGATYMREKFSLEYYLGRLCMQH